MNRKIIVNADDFGRHEAINRAVEYSVLHGILRSATLMPGGKAFDSAVTIARRQKKLGVGIHFTLVNGNPLLPPAEIPSLVNKNGLFYDDYTIFVKRFLQGKINLMDVRAELGAQLEKMQRTGLTLTHADSHQHMHVLPGIIDTYLKLLQAAKIPAMRTPKTPLFVGHFGGLGQLAGRIGLGTLARLADRKARRRGIRTPNHFSGIVAGEAVTKAALRQIILNLRPGVTEIMMHPGTDNAILHAECTWQHDFELELAALLSSDIKTLLSSKGINVINFKNLLR